MENFWIWGQALIWGIWGSDITIDSAEKPLFFCYRREERSRFQLEVGDRQMVGDFQLRWRKMNRSKPSSGVESGCSHPECKQI